MALEVKIFNSDKVVSYTKIKNNNSVFIVHAERMDLSKVYYYCPATKIYKYVNELNNFKNRIIEISSDGFDLKIIIDDSTYKLIGKFCEWILSEDNKKFLNNPFCTECEESNTICNRCVDENKKIINLYEKKYSEN